ETGSDRHSSKEGSRSEEAVKDAERGTSGAPRSGLGSLTAVRAEATRSPIFGAEAHFLLEARKQSRWEGRGCIFSRSLMVQLIAFGLIFSVEPGAVRLR